jgi:transcriptional regulator with XRE-family HTH domain
VTTAEQFGRNVRRHRRALGISQEQLAKASFLTRDTVTSLERGAAVVRLHTLLSLAYALGVKPTELLRGVTADEQA